MKRRDFIQKGLMGSIAPIFLNGLSLDASGKINDLAMEDDRVLVVIQLNGGNDGLNTVIPKDQYAQYLNVRKNIAIQEDNLLSIPQDPTVGLHPSLIGFKTLFEEGKAALIHDVGYPQPNFSHFRSMDIWNSASDSDKNVLSGWVGRYLSNDHPDFPNNYPNENYGDPLAIQINSVINTALQGPVYPMGMTLENPNSFFEIVTNEEEGFNNSLAANELNYLRQVADQTNKYASTIKEAANRVNAQVDYPENYIGYQLKTAAKLIGGGLKTKFYFVQLGGFDTHSDQTDKTNPSIGNHARILKELSDAISSFMADLQKMGKSKNVMAMTYSEFGRRIRSNASTGTDHGAAAPMFVFGEQLNSRVFGENFKIPSSVGEEDSVPMQYDFRSVYTSMLQDWFCSPSSVTSDVMFKSLQTLPIVHGSACGGITSIAPEESNILLKVFPNPVSDFTTVEFKNSGGLNILSIFNSKGQQLLNLDNEKYELGIQQKVISLNDFPIGTYFLRWQNEHQQKVVKLMKI